MVQSIMTRAACEIWDASLWARFVLANWDVLLSVLTCDVESQNHRQV